MSTRATYSIKSKENTVNFYIHHDGYKQGAAFYFLQMVNAYHKNVNPDPNGLYRTASGGYAEAFLRGNSGASFTSGHNVHGDTEYRYTLDTETMTLTVWERPSSWEWSEAIGKKYALVDFINKYQVWDEKAIAFYAVISEYGSRKEMHTNESIMAKIEDSMRTLKVWEKNGHNRGANWDSMQKRVKLLKDVIYQTA